MKSKIVIIVFAAVCSLIVFNEDKEHTNQFVSDKCGYYIYLPAIFIYHDLAKLDFNRVIYKEYNNSLYLQFVGGKTLDKYPVGTAFFELPLFCLAHAYCLLFHTYKADGFSLPYQLAGIFSNILWVMAALFILRSFFKRYFTDTVAALTLLFISFGTNLYAYTAFDIGMSHPYSFFLFCALLYLADTLYKNPSRKNFVLLGITAGFIFIVRPINILAMLVFMLWRVNNFSTIRERAIFFAKNYAALLYSLVFFFLVVLIQFSYWRYITGRWIFYAYIGEGFNFGHPQIINGLFSYRKGWFVYTPMAFVAILCFYYLWKKDRKAVPGLVVFFAVMIYCVFSWRQWWYGGSFGCRPLIESYAFLSLPLAAATGHFLHNTGKVRKTLFATLMGFIVVLNIFQTYQYSMGLIHWSRMTKAYYWHIFGQYNSERARYNKYLLDDSTNVTE